MKLRRASRLATTLFACISLIMACSDDTPTQPDGGAPTDAVTDLSLNDGPPVDAIDDAPPSDAGCECSRVDAGVRPDVGAIPLPCFCEISSWPSAFTPRPLCASYDAVLVCPDGGRPVFVQTFAGCNLSLGPLSHPQWG
jgi:hypothetical protein